MVRRLVFLLAVLFAVSATASEITSEAIIASMNSCRAELGLPALRIDKRLEAAAQDRMHDMEEREYWSHVAPDGRSPFTWVKQRGYLFRYAGENLAAGFETTEVVVSSWMESKGHRENILSPIYQDCGIAILDGSTTGRATGKSIVVLFGRTDGGPAADAQ